MLLCPSKPHRELTLSGCRRSYGSISHLHMFSATLTCTLLRVHTALQSLTVGASGFKAQCYASANSFILMLASSRSPKIGRCSFQGVLKTLCALLDMPKDDRLNDIIGLLEDRSQWFDCLDSRIGAIDTSLGRLELSHDTLGLRCDESISFFETRMADVEHKLDIVIKAMHKSPPPVNMQSLRQLVDELHN